MAMLIPNLSAVLIPGISAAGFSLGEDFSSIKEKIGIVDWYESNACIDEVLINSAGWVGVRSKVGSAIGLDKTVESFSYRNDLVSLDFGDAKKLYRIVVGKGYQGKFKSVMPGDDLLLLSDSHELDFNDMDDDFLIIESGRYIEGISFITDYRASLEHAPIQKIEYISIHDWSFR
ncbi:hypothetical protein OU997_06430 [Pseudomonas sp. SL4(2022)]|uniref:hypothetical protein n=1 Tax=Pseudomonas sp. SL4(2022) TaxID=2994661 RepID=UPI00226FE794|nr:hypothetical protein [Pseudomonas sp. SL4(2022)]WAC45799.1 hypothetical protein OU997_06430 [Pseudomonas sp. SL4(2022)]